MISHWSHESVANVFFKKHDEMLTENEPTFYTLPVAQLKNLSNMKTTKEVLYSSYKLRSEEEFSRSNFHELCKGERHQVRLKKLVTKNSFLIFGPTVQTLGLLWQTSQEEMRLFCWYEHQIHPYFLFGPLQVELLSTHPKTEVVMVHNVLGQQLLAYLGNDTGRNFFYCAWNDPKQCLYSQIWIEGDATETAVRTLRLASRITGLKTNQNRILVNAHVPGGHHDVHLDSVRMQFD